MTDARGLSSAHLKFLEARGIDAEIASGMGLYSAKFGQGGDNDNEPEAHRSGNILVFPYVDRGDEEVNAKFRGPQKKFWQRKGARKTFWNALILDDPQIREGRQALVITEGELDALVAIQDGHPWSVSVPDGAPADVDHLGRPIPMKPDRELTPENDPKFEYVFNNWERLGHIKRFILATDGDGPGQRLRDELARRLGKVRCAFVEYPEGLVVPIQGVFGKRRRCKDLNEVHLHLGAEAVLKVLQSAKPYPVSGLYTLDDYEDRGDLTTYDIGFAELDDHLKLYRGGFMVVSGIPSHGKSVFVDQLGFNMAARHGWNIAIATFEEDVRPLLRNKLTSYYLQKLKQNWTYQDRQQADEFIRRHFCFITDDPRKGQDNEARSSVDWLCDRAADAVIRYGIDMLIVDPWNELDHVRLPGEMRDEYTARAIRTVKRFSREYEVASVVVVHPTKEAGNRVQRDDEEKMSIYDVADGAMWFNKAELAVIISREKGEPNAVGRAQSNIGIRKVKFREAGKVGDIFMAFDTRLHMFNAGPVEPDLISGAA